MDCLLSSASTQVNEHTSGCTIRALSQLKNSWVSTARVSLVQTGCARPVFLFNAVATTAAGTWQKIETVPVSAPAAALHTVSPMHIVWKDMNVILWCREQISHVRIFFFYSALFIFTDEITNSFRRYGHLVVDWPHKAESKSYFPPKGNKPFSHHNLCFPITSKSTPINITWRASPPCSFIKNHITQNPWLMLGNHGGVCLSK